LKEAKYMKNTKNKTVKAKSKKQAKSKVVNTKIEVTPQVTPQVVAEASPVETTSIKIEVTPAPVVNPAPQVKRGKGRPDGVGSNSLVSLKDLVNVLSENAKIPLSNTLIKSLNMLGTRIESTPFIMKSGMQDILKKYNLAKASNVAVVNLNESEQAA